MSRPTQKEVIENIPSKGIDALTLRLNMERVGFTDVSAAIRNAMERGAVRVGTNLKLFIANQ